MPHSAEERRDRAKEDGGRFEDGVAAVRRTESLSIRSIACYGPLAIRRTRSGVAGGCRMDSACRAMYCDGGGGGRRGLSL